MLRYLLLLFIPVISTAYLPLHSLQEKSSSSGANKIHIKNTNNEAYTIALSIGTPPQKLELLLSTGNSSVRIMQLSWIASADCFNCRVPLNAYDITKSSTYMSKGITNTINVSHKQNGYSSFWALLSTDNFTLSGGKESSQFFWLAVQNLNYPGQVIDGIFSLGLDNLAYPTFIESLYYSGIIDSPTFSIYLSDVKEGKNDTDSRLLLGNTDLTPYIGTNAVRYLNVLSYSIGWTTNLDSIFIGNTNFYLNSWYAAFDVNSPYIFIPYADFSTIYDYFIYFHSCEWNSDIIQCNDKNIENYPSITFVLNNQYFQIPNTAYLRYDKKADTMTFLFMQNSYSNWVLGSPFLRQYVSVFTQGIGTQSTIGLAYIDIKSKKSSSKSDFWSDWSLYFYIGIGVAGGLIAIILFIILCRLRKRRQARKNQENNERLISNIIEPPKPELKPKKSRSKPRISNPSPPPPPPKIAVENPLPVSQSGIADSESGIYPDLEPVPILRQNQQESAETGAYPFLPPIKVLEP